MAGADIVRRVLEIRRAAAEPAAGLRPSEAVPFQAGGGRSPQSVPPEAPRVQTRPVAVDAQWLRSQRVILPEDQGPVAQSFKLLRTQVLHALRREGMNSVAVVSPTSGDGRTLTAINLAVSLGDDPDHTALLVDLDLRRPQVHERFGIRVEHGVERTLFGTGDVAASMVRPEGFRSLVLLPAAGPLTGSAELLGAETTRRATRQINGRYANRIVVYDLPPLLETAHALAFLPCVDAVLLVAREGVTRREDIVRGLQLLRDKPVVGTVLTAARASRGL